MAVLTWQVIVPIFQSACFSLGSLHCYREKSVIFAKNYSQRRLNREWTRVHANKVVV